MAAGNVGLSASEPPFRAADWWLGVLEELAEQPTFFGRISITAVVMGGQVVVIERVKQETEKIEN